MTHIAATDNAIRDIIAEHDRKNLDVIARAAAMTASGFSSGSGCWGGR